MRPAPTAASRGASTIEVIVSQVANAMNTIGVTG